MSPNCHKGWWEMCAGVSSHSLRTGTCHWGWRGSSRVIRTVRWRKMLPLQNTSLLWPSQALHLNIQSFSSFSHYLVDVTEVQSIQSKVSINTFNNGKETLSKRQQSFIWGGVTPRAEVPEMLCSAVRVRMGQQKVTVSLPSFTRLALQNSISCHGVFHMG